MKKILSYLTIGIMVLSILISVSPELKLKVLSISGEHTYASTNIPVPNYFEKDKYANKDSEKNRLFYTYKYELLIKK